jgi:hypothetical protein
MNILHAMGRDLNEVMMMKGFTHKVGGRTAFGFPCSGNELVGLSHLINPDATHEAATLAVNVLRRTADPDTPEPTEDDIVKLKALINFNMTKEPTGVGSDLLDRILDLDVTDSVAADLLLDVVRKLNDPDWVHSMDRKLRNERKANKAKTH